jgi:hypothetical protein
MEKKTLAFTISFVDVDRSGAAEEGNEKVTNRKTKNRRMNL